MEHTKAGTLKLGALYLNRYAWPGPLIETPPAKSTKLIVVIPCFNEPDIQNSLKSIEQCEKPECDVEIIIVINHSEDDHESLKEFNKATCKLLEDWISSNHQYTYHIIKAYDLPFKKAGVGLARKIGMDEAARRFESINEVNGIIVCFDADCTCTSNYLVEIERTYKNQSNTNAALLYFEHDIIKASEEKITMAITDYELHLRYYVQALKYSKFPFSYHTVGSCITVPSEIYQKQGGMNTRKAGEDFYFLQRIFPLGNIQNITSAVVFPSPRPSYRVPFGTGRAVSEIIKSENDEYFTYNPKIFKDFRKFNESVPMIWNLDNDNDFIHSLPISIAEYLKSIDFTNQIGKFRKNFKTQPQFINAFYNWFNGFKALKYVHFARDNYYRKVEILESVRWIVQELRGFEIKDKEQALNLMREIDQSE